METSGEVHLLNWCFNCVNHNLRIPAVTDMQNKVAHVDRKWTKSRETELYSSSGQKFSQLNKPENQCNQGPRNLDIRKVLDDEWAWPVMTKVVRRENARNTLSYRKKQNIIFTLGNRYGKGK